MKLLEILNRHSRDARVQFFEEGHRYLIDGKIIPTSVTTVIKKHFSPFNPDEVISKMQRFGAFRKKYGDKTPEDVKKEWNTMGTEASQKGTKLHAYIEEFLNGNILPEPTDLTTEIGYFYRFMESLPYSKLPYRTEWLVHDQELNLAGSIDAVFLNPDGTVSLADWKCSKGVKFKSPYGKGNGPCAIFDDCNGCHYFLQLNIYKYILERNYDVKVADMSLVIFHTNNPGPLVLPVPDLQDFLKANQEAFFHQIKQ